MLYIPVQLLRRLYTLVILCFVLLALHTPTLAGNASATSPSLQTQNTTNTAENPAQTPTTLMNGLTMEGVEADITALGYSLVSVHTRLIAVQAYNGSIPKHCASDGSMEGLYTSEGLAVRNVRYKACPDGQPPLPGNYSVDGYACTVVYNRLSPKKLAILAHELAHCIYRDYGQYGEFDSAYKELRGVQSISQTGLRELVADDFMICQHGLDTDWTGDANYYNRFGVPRPTPETCAQYNALVDTYLI